MNTNGIFLATVCVIACCEVVSAQLSERPPQNRWIELPAHEGRERIETDRHDFTQSPTVVGRGVFQIEGGYSFFRRSDGGETEHSHTGPELMLRYGINENVECRIRYNEAWLFGESEDRRGAEDLRWSFKVRLNDQRNWVPEGALELRFTAPTGGDEWSTDSVEFGLDYIYGWRLNEKIELYGSTGFATNALGDFAFVPADPADDDFMLYTQSIAIGAEMTEQMTLYAEFFGLFSDGLENDDVSPVFFNIGLDYYFTDDLVFDLRVGHGVNDDADDFFYGIGCGLRF